MSPGSNPPDPNLAVSRLVFADGENRWVSARTRDHKYLVNVRRDRRREFFYDLTRDPGEREPESLEAQDSLEALERLRSALAAAESQEGALRQIYGDPESETIEVPEDVRERLRSLGYVP
jgi:hypothetical protein